MLNNIGLPGLLLIAVVLLVLFGRGKVSSLMGEVGKGINAFKKGIKEETAEIENRPETIGHSMGVRTRNASAPTSRRRFLSPKR